MLQSAMVEQLPITSSRVMLLKVRNRMTELTTGYASTLYFWSALGFQLRFCGTTAIHGFDNLIIHGSAEPDNPKFTAFYIKDNKVVAVASMGTDPSVSLSAELFRGISIIIIFRLINVQKDDFLPSTV